LKSSLGDVYKNVPLKQGPVGPPLFPDTHVLEAPHHPQLPCFKQISFLDDH